jgi:hypothetical protein
MVARLLNLAGVYLGEEDELIGASPDNPDGHWEHRAFVALNDDVLEALGGGWDMPPALPAGWEADPSLELLRTRGSDLVTSLSHRSPWGWKDPRNSLTLPFWYSLVPDMRVVVCVRSPLEVFHSLRKRRSTSLGYAFHLWRIYHRVLLEALDDRTTVFTHFEAYASDPGAELKRVTSALGLKANRKRTNKAAGAYRDELRRERSKTLDLFEGDVPDDVLELYWRVSARCGPIYHLRLRDELGPSKLELLAATHPAAEHLRLIALEARVAAAEARLKSARAEATVHRRETAQLQARVAELEAMLAPRATEKRPEAWERDGPSSDGETDSRPAHEAAAVEPPAPVGEADVDG